MSKFPSSRATTHRIFLCWLLALVCMLAVLGGLCLLGLPQTALLYDHSHLTAALFGLFALAEIAGLRQSILLSRDLDAVERLRGWLDANNVYHGVAEGETVVLTTDSPSAPPLLVNGLLARYIGGLFLADGERGEAIDQSLLLDHTADELEARTSLPEFLSDRIVWIGILATILGVILAFWPMISGSSGLDSIKSNLGGFFGGIAVAFIPTAVSFVLKIALDFHIRVLDSGVRRLVSAIGHLGETRIIPDFIRSRRAYTRRGIY